MGRLMEFSQEELDRVFGFGSSGDTPEARAASSKVMFVRSQSQLSVYNHRAKGLQMTAAWALRQFGFQALLQAIDDGVVVIAESMQEPARTLKEQRLALGLTYSQVAHASGLKEDEVKLAEQFGSVTPIRKLRALAQSLGLSDELISVKSGAGVDRTLAYRLKSMKEPGQPSRLSPSCVAKLAEAAWITSQQMELVRYLDIPCKITTLQNGDRDYSYPAWRRGYQLAEITRQNLGLDASAPIPSMRALLDELGIPLVQTEMGLTIAGATVANGHDRGIAVNIDGYNKDVWVRRMTLSHELGHLLWDPDDRLKRLHVDRYDSVERADINSTDVVESRTNAFAIAFLAPVSVVRRIIARGDDIQAQVSELMQNYGLSGTASKYHLLNVGRQMGFDLDIKNLDVKTLPIPDDSWKASEDWTVDFFPVAGVPVSRRGRFAGLVIKALKEGKVSMDTASSWLAVSPDAIKGHEGEVLSLTMN
jgi:Zn-dependent peptidase ImmA (M78 family)